MSDVNASALKADIHAAIINRKANACPIIIRTAWHASGTFDKNDNSGGSDGATMRFEPECSDGANAGLSITRDMLKPIKANNPNVSIADIWAYAGCVASELTGGPKIPFKFGRSDAADGSQCPPNGRLPDATQGAEHLREVFYRMGFNDKEIVALSGAHTLGRCHIVRSGFDGPWTSKPLEFDNEYFTNLMFKEWEEKIWHEGYDGPLQYTDKETKTLLMLPTDLALRTDPEFCKYAELYANDEQAFFNDFSDAFAKLLALGCGNLVCPMSKAASQSATDKASAEFREAAMHGSLGPVMAAAKSADVHAKEENSGRTALHKAAFWGHDGTITFLVDDCKLDVNVQDFSGDTALNDAARFGHEGVVKILLRAGADLSIRNVEGKDALTIALDNSKDSIVNILNDAKAKL